MVLENMNGEAYDGRSEKKSIGERENWEISYFLYGKKKLSEIIGDNLLF